jgi:hypothetical protein
MGGRATLYAEFADAAYRRPRGPDGDSHSLVGNLETAPADLWDARPEGCERSIREIVIHAGFAKLFYDDHAFRSGTAQWFVAPAWPAAAGTWSAGETLAWLDSIHARWLESLRSLSDDALDLPVRMPRGGTWPARAGIELMIEHDIYHAGEINHIRALLTGTDAWAHA